MKRPNILILTLDTQRVSNMSCYGYPLETTPSLSKFAQKVTLFKNCISPGTWTLPSHASLFTGRYVCGHGADQHHTRLEKEFPTLAEVLSTQGYETVNFGGGPWVDRYDGNARGFEEVSAKSSRYKTEKEESNRIAQELVQRGEEHDQKGCLRLTLRAIDYMKKAKEKKKPFFYYIRYLEPHMPYRPCNPYRRRFLPENISDEYAQNLGDEYSRIKHTQAALPVLSRKDIYSFEIWSILRNLYDGATVSLDSRLQVIFDFLKLSGLEEDTMVIVWADHGEELGEHFPLASHCASVYDSQVRVPLLISYPKVFPQGKAIDTLVQTHDIFPTILEICGIRDDQYWKNIQSQSLIPILKGEPGRGLAMAELFRPLQTMAGMINQHPDLDIRFLNRDLKCICCDDYKYIWSSNGVDELYHITSDSDEQNNLISDRPEIARDLYHSLKTFLLSIKQVDYGDLLIRAVPTKENLRNLRAFGLLRADPKTLKQMYPEAHQPNFPYGL